MPFSRNVASWTTFTVCGAVLTIGLVDQAFGGMMGLVFVGLALVALTFLALLVTLPRRWRDQGWRSFIPSLLCLVVLPAIWILGHYLLIARFYWHRAQYEALALTVSTGSHPEKLIGNELRLARWVKLTHASDLQKDPIGSHHANAGNPPPADHQRVVAVHFLVATHGFAGHAGFMRTFHPDVTRLLAEHRGADGWRFSKHLTDDWYLVGN